MSETTGGRDDRPDSRPLEEKGTLHGSAHVENEPQRITGLDVSNLAEQPDD